MAHHRNGNGPCPKRRIQEQPTWQAHGRRRRHAVQLGVLGVGRSPSPVPEHWIAGSLDRRITGSLDHWITGSLDRWVTGSLDHWITGSRDHWIAGSLDRWIIGSLDHRILDHWITGSLDQWISGSLDHWINGSITGSLDRWIIGSLDRWVTGSLDRWITVGPRVVSNPARHSGGGRAPHRESSGAKACGAAWRACERWVVNTPPGPEAPQPAGPCGPAA